jgi:hypothetical protein
MGHPPVIGVARAVRRSPRVRDSLNLPVVYRLPIHYLDEGSTSGGVESRALRCGLSGRPLLEKREKWGTPTVSLPMP